MNRAIHLALVSLLFSSLCTLAVYFFAVWTAVTVPSKFIITLGVIAFILSFVIFYFSYELSIYRRIRNITQRVNFLTGRKKNEPQPLVNIPEEKPDPLNELDEEIIYLEETRQQEIEKLKKLENYRKEFLGNVSHELKTPIFNIQGYISTLIDGGIHDANINVDYLKRADRSVDRMIRIVDDLEQISQLESGVLEPKFETYDILEQVKDIFVSLEMQAFSRKITFGFLEVYNNPVYVYADKHRIRQVLVNLITNSIKYGKENGKTVAGFLEKEDEITIFISDNGIGIAKEHLPRLFERFYRVDKGRSREQGGTGLGLAIAKHIIEAHQQTIKVTSKVGEGTTFSFTLKKGIA